MKTLQMPLQSQQVVFEGKLEVKKIRNIDKDAY